MRNSRALRIRAAGGLARLEDGVSGSVVTAQENKSLHLKSLAFPRAVLAGNPSLTVQAELAPRDFR